MCLDIFGIQNISLWIGFRSGHPNIKLLDPVEYLINFSLCLVLLSNQVRFGSLDPNILPILTFFYKYKEMNRCKTNMLGLFYIHNY